MTFRPITYKQTNSQPSLQSAALRLRFYNCINLVKAITCLHSGKNLALRFTTASQITTIDSNRELPTHVG